MYELYLNQLLTEQAAELDKVIQNVTTLINHFTAPSKLRKFNPLTVQIPLITLIVLIVILNKTALIYPIINIIPIHFHSPHHPQRSSLFELNLLRPRLSMIYLQSSSYFEKLINFNYASFLCFFVKPTVFCHFNSTTLQKFFHLCPLFFLNPHLYVVFS